MGDLLHRTQCAEAPEVTAIGAHAHATIRRVDASHGNTLAQWKKMGEPRYLTQAKIATLMTASEIGAPKSVTLHGGQRPMTVPEKGLALIEIR